MRTCTRLRRMERCKRIAAGLRPMDATGNAERHRKAEAIAKKHKIPAYWARLHPTKGLRLEIVEP